MSFKDDPVNFLKQARKSYKAAVKKAESSSNPEYIHFLESKRREDIDAASICVDCPNVLLLTENVNDILQHLKKDPKNEIPSSILNEIDSLEGMFYFTQEENRQSLELVASEPCLRRDLGTKHPFYPSNDNFDDDNHIMVFTKNVSFKNISQAQLIDINKRKTYFFKGTKPHEDVIIKVVRNTNGEGSVSYYRHKEIVVKARKEKAKKDLEAKIIRPLTNEEKIAAKKKLEEDGPIVFGGTEDGKKDELVIDYGWKTEGDSFIPKKVTVLEVEGISEFESMSITGGAEVSSKRQAVDLNISGNKGKDFVAVEVNADTQVKLKGRSDFDTFAFTGQAKMKGQKKSAAVQLRNDKNQEVMEISHGTDGISRLGVPHKFNVYDTGVIVDGKVVVGQDGSYGGTWVLSDRDSDTQYVDIGVRGRDDGRGISLGHSQKLSRDSRISVKLTHDDYSHRTESGAWVSFSLDF